jgi:hypothetical protein
MTRWIAFDQDSANKLSLCFGSAADIEQRMSEPDKAFQALLQTRNSIVLLPSDSAKYSLVAKIRIVGDSPAAPPSDSLPSQREPRQIATGFLGLVDEMVWEEETPKRSWWQRLLD